MARIKNVGAGPTTIIGAGPTTEGPTMTRIEFNAIRRKLRELNLEYSALLRDRFGEGRFARMAKLRAERNALVALIAENDGRDTGALRRNGAFHPAAAEGFPLDAQA